MIRDLYGEYDNEAVERLRDALFATIKGFTEYTRKDLSDEHEYAVDNDYCVGIGVFEGCGINGREWRKGLYAEGQLAIRASDVRADPCAFSKYTVEFVRLIDESVSLRTPAEIEQVLARYGEAVAAL
jgi:hypothetical protein